MDPGAYFVTGECPWFDHQLVSHLREGGQVVGLVGATAKHREARERADRLGFARKKGNVKRLRDFIIKSGNRPYGFIAEGLAGANLRALLGICIRRDILVAVWADRDLARNVGRYTHFVFPGDVSPIVIPPAVRERFGAVPPAGIYNREGERLFIAPSEPSNRRGGGAVSEKDRPRIEVAPRDKSTAKRGEELAAIASEAYRQTVKEMEEGARRYDDGVNAIACTNKAYYAAKQREAPSDVNERLWYAYNGGVLAGCRVPSYRETMEEGDNIVAEIEAHCMNPAHHEYVASLVSSFPYFDRLPTYSRREANGYRRGGGGRRNPFKIFGGAPPGFWKLIGTAVLIVTVIVLIVWVARKASPLFTGETPRKNDAARQMEELARAARGVPRAPKRPENSVK